MEQETNEDKSNLKDVEEAIGEPKELDIHMGRYNLRRR